MFTIQEILTATQGQLIAGDPDGKVRGVSIDSRAIRAGELFIAIKGERLDGHAFISQVVKKGVRVFLVHKAVKVKGRRVTVIKVEDTTKALGHLARFHRLKFVIPVVAITGSAGKTTTKEMVAAVLKEKYRVLANEGTQNNHIGVPLTLLKLRSKHQAAVIEAGTNQPGDIPWLTKIACPTIAVLTNIGESHLEKLKTLSGVYREKIHLAKSIGTEGYVIFNNDDAHLKNIPNEKFPAHLVPFSVQTNGLYRAKNVRISASSGLTFTCDKKPFFLKTFSCDMAYNALAAIACGRILNVPVGDIQSALKDFRFDRGRQEIVEKKGLTIVNDTYNANPVSMRSAVATLDAFPARGRRILICADMLELGKNTRVLHQKVGECVAASRVDVLMTVGDQARWILETAHRYNPGLVVFGFSKPHELQDYLHVLCQKGDVVLVKGSRRMKMETVVEFLIKELRN